MAELKRLLGVRRPFDVYLERSERAGRQAVSKESAARIKALCPHDLKAFGYG